MAMRRDALSGIFFLMLLLVAGRTHASPIQVFVDTSTFAGTSAALAFDFANGGPPPNSVTISGFASIGGTLGSTTATPGVTGAFPGDVTIPDTNGIFNEYLQYFTLGTSLRFTFDTTGFPPSPPGIIPDAFSFFLLDGNTLLSLVTTSDPTGADALLLYSVGGNNPLSVYASTAVTVRTVPPANAAPEPGALALLLAGLLAAGAMRARGPRDVRWRRIGQFPKMR